MQNFMITLLICSVTMSALALIYMATTPLLAKRYSAKSQYYAWLIIVIGLIIPFRPHFDNAIVKMDIPADATFAIQKPTTAPVETAAATVPLSSPSIWQVLAVIWLIGLIAFLVCFIVKHYRFIKMTERWSERISNEQMLLIFNSVKSAMGITKKIDLQLCASIGSPTMIGFIRPRILLPKEDFAQDELRFILRHELVHYKRKDLWYKCFVLIATAIHWFNPLIYLIVKAIDVQCELSCDDEVVRNTDADIRQQYSETIIGVVKYQSKLKTALSTNFYGGKKGMKRRIFSIMDVSKKKAGFAIVCCMLIFTMGTGFAFAANTNTPAIQETITDTTAVKTNFVINGNSQQPNSGGLTQQPNKDITESLEAYTIAEYEALLNTYKEYAPIIVESGKVTQEQADQVIAYMENELKKLKADNGKGNYVIYKPKASSTWTDINGAAWAESININVTVNDPAISNNYSGKLTLSDGRIVDIGSYGTKDERLSAAKLYCEAEVKAGRMTQAEADDILKSF